MTAPNPDTVGNVLWQQYIGQTVAVVDVNTQDVALGTLSSMMFNGNNGCYQLNFSGQIMRLNINDKVTVTRIVVTSTMSTLGAIFR